MVGRHFKHAAVGTFGDQGVAVGQTLHTADEGAVEAVAVHRGEEPGFSGRVLPHDLHGHGVDFQHAGIVAQGRLHAGRSTGVRHVVAAPAAVVEHEDVAAARQGVRNHVRMMLPDDPADSFGLRTVVVIRAKLPSDFAGGFGNDENNVGFAAVHDDIVGMETLVARVIPFVRAEHGHGVDVHPVAHTFGLRGTVIGVAGEGAPSTKITSPFGPRWRRMHNGLDLKVNIGDTIVAAFDGKVRIVKYERRGYGKYVVIRHDNGLETVYGHLSKQLVEENQLVKAGEVIGLGGNTGRSTGSHLHFETRFLGIAINPIYMFDFPKQDIVADTYTFRKAKGVKRAGSHDTQVADGTIRYHKVKSGDTLSRIAKLRGVSVSTLCKLNRIKPTTTLRIGQVLRCS